MAKRLKARGPPIRSHSNHGGISKKNMSESQIAAHGRMNWAIRPVQTTTKMISVLSRNIMFSMRSLQGTAAQPLHQRAAGKIRGFALEARPQRIAAAIRQDAPEVGALHRHSANRTR